MPISGLRIDFIATDENRTRIASILTNANGFYSFYYLGIGGDFIQPSDYFLTVTVPGGVAGENTQTTLVTYNPSTSLDSSYFVVGAQTVRNFSVPVP